MSNLSIGFAERLAHEVNRELNSSNNRNIVASDVKWVAESNRRYAAWIGIYNVLNDLLIIVSGGSMLGSLSTFQNQAITKAEYEENAEAKLSVIHKKTF